MLSNIKDNYVANGIYLYGLCKLHRVRKYYTQEHKMTISIFEFF